MVTWLSGTYSGTLKNRIFIESRLKTIEMKALKLNKFLYRLNENDEMIGQVIYSDNSFTTAKLHLAGESLLEAHSTGFFGSRVLIKRDGQNFCVLRIRFSGTTSISFTNGPEFVLTYKGIFFNTYIIEDLSGKELISYLPDSRWGFYRRGYEICTEKGFQDKLLILIGLFSINFLNESISGSVGWLG